MMTKTLKSKIDETLNVENIYNNIILINLILELL